jgi:AAHS family 4-hydroxybenzoate transporter-like MFS transporter
MMVVSCGFTIGGVVGGLIAAALIPEFGWRSVFFIGGALPFVLGLLMWFALPESVQFLIQRKEGLTRVRRNLERCAASVKDEPMDTVFLVPESRPKGAPLVALFRDGRARVTGLLWVVNFCNLLDMYFLSNWLPTVIREAGYSTGIAVYAGTALWVGGVVGTVILGRIIDRVGFTPVLTTTFLLAVVATAAIGSPLVITSIFLLFLSIFLSGFAVIGGQPALNALAATYYPTALRSTGIGWSLGIGRIGSVVGPVAGGLLMHLHWSSTSLFIAAAVPAICSMLGVLSVHFVMRGQAAPKESTAYQ